MALAAWRVRCLISDDRQYRTASPPARCGLQTRQLRHASQRSIYRKHPDRFEDNAESKTKAWMPEGRVFKVAQFADNHHQIEPRGAWRMVIVLSLIATFAFVDRALLSLVV